MFALEYHCAACRTAHPGRFFKTPADLDLKHYREAESRLSKLQPQFIPDDQIPAGDETDRLHRWGYRRYALRAGAPFVFTYHHNQLESYLPVAVAILDSRLVCSASLPCPAEMGASIHINRTGSSILDTVFVCRSTGRFPRRWLTADAKAMAELVADEIGMLRQAHFEPTQGDIRCMIFGHLIRLAVWHLRDGWSAHGSASVRLQKILEWIHGFGGMDRVRAHLGKSFAAAPRRQDWELHEQEHTAADEVSF